MAATDEVVKRFAQHTRTMKLVLILITFSFSLVSNSQHCFEVHQIKSKVLKEKRSIWVGLPTNYHKDSSYAVVYVLDAEHRFELTYTLTKELFENQSTIPKVIVVGIPHIDRFHRINDLTFTDSKVNGQGKEDTIGYFNASLTGNGLFFLQFLENEVLPFVDKKYSTNGFNTLMGHSIGGYFCAYILPIQKSFSAFQIYDPSIWYNDGDAIKHLQKELDSNYKNNIFISKGNAFEGPREYVDHHLLMIDSLGTFLRNYPKLTITTATYEKDHNAMYLFSLMDGLTALFKQE
jgi:predicted alpha/beta superfamily hydrolase